MKKNFIIYGIVYLFVAAIIFPYVRWYADNPDTFQYMAIAEKYSKGNWSHAINGYWSPMISWLLIIPLSIFSNEIIAFKILQLIIGLFTLYQLMEFLNKIPLKQGIINILTFIFIVFIIDYSLLNPSADLLFMGMMITLLNLLIEDFLFDKKSAMLAGLVGALLYLTKAFGFPFFIAITFVIILIRVKKADYKKLLANSIRMYTVFLIICMGWIILISTKYGHFTISEAAAFNMSRDVAPLPNRSEELEILGNGLFAPGINSYSAWESPGDYVSGERVTLFSSPADYLKIVKRNILSIYYFDFRNQVGIFFLILLSITILYRRKDVFRNQSINTILLLILLIYCGYSLILYHHRYAWINTILMLTLSLYFIQIINRNNKRRRLTDVLSILLILLAVKRPVKEILFTQDKEISTHWILNSIRHPFDTLWIFYRPDRLIEKSIADIKQRKIIQGNIASLKARNTERHPYTSSLRISQSLKLPYYGQVNDSLNFIQQEVELRKMRIDYLITWNNTQWGTVQPVYMNQEAGMKIYSLK